MSKFYKGGHAAVLFVIATILSVMLNTLFPFYLIIIVLFFVYPIFQIVQSKNTITVKEVLFIALKSIGMCLIIFIFAKLLDFIF